MTLLTPLIELEQRYKEELITLQENLQLYLENFAGMTSHLDLLDDMDQYIIKIQALESKIVQVNKLFSQTNTADREDFKVQAVATDGWREYDYDDDSDEWRQRMLDEGKGPILDETLQPDERIYQPATDDEPNKSWLTNGPPSQEAIVKGIDPEITLRTSHNEKEKAIATKRGEPYIAVLNFDINPADPLASGSIEFDWNDHFISELRNQGVQGKTDDDIVNNWFERVCRNILLNTYENDVAMNDGLSNKRDLGNGRTEIS